MKCKITKKEAHFNYKKANFDGMTEQLKTIDWEKELHDQPVNDMWYLLKAQINSATNNHVPKTSNSNRKVKQWMDKDTLNKVRKKHKLFRKWAKLRDENSHLEYLKARNQAKRACKRAKKKLEETVVRNSKNNPKSFWSFVNSKTKTKSDSGNLIKKDGSKTNSDSEKAEVLNDFFKSVFTIEPDGDLPHPPTYEYDSELENITITVEEVQNLLSNLNINKAPGPDELPPIVLSKLAETLAYPITIIFNASVAQGKLPEEWCTARVSPIFKKGNKSEAGNYRPVSLTCILCKVMETLIRGKVVEHLERNKLLCPAQHGFVNGRSCTTQLLEVLDEWTQILDDRGAIDVIYMDFQKAFDSVPHRRLLAKVEAFGISGKILGWIRDFLSNRTQKVVVNGSKSNCAMVSSGIPQGSVLGPVLFTLYINDLPTSVDNHVKIFADDTKIFAQSNKDGATQSLQMDLERLCDWSNKWLLKFHPQKCSVMKIGKRKSDATYSMRDSTGEKVALKEIETEKDLGVYIDNKLQFNHHVAQIALKANRVVGIIRRSFEFLDEELFVKLYKAIVRPILEYGQSAWQPQFKYLCQEIENVQRRATKLVSSIREKPYPERLQILKLPCLEHRRRRGDMIDVYKYVHGVYNCQLTKFSVMTSRRNRGHSLKLQKHHHRLNLRANFFSVRTINAWNSLPEHVVTAPSVNAFKNRVDAYWQGKHSIYHPEC